MLAIRDISLTPGEPRKPVIRSERPNLQVEVIADPNLHSVSMRAQFVFAWLGVLGGLKRC